MDAKTAHQLEQHAAHLAEVIHAEGVDALHLASEETKAAAQNRYLDAIGHDVDVVFNATEWRDAQKRGQTAQQFLDMLLFAEAEPVIEPLIETALNELQRDLNVGAAVDKAIHDLKERAPLMRGAA